MSQQQQQQPATAPQGQSGPSQTPQSQSTQSTQSGQPTVGGGPSQNMTSQPASQPSQQVKDSKDEKSVGAQNSSGSSRSQEPEVVIDTSQLPKQQSGPSGLSAPWGGMSVPSVAIFAAGPMLGAVPHDFDGPHAPAGSTWTPPSTDQFDPDFKAPPPPSRPPAPHGGAPNRPGSRRYQHAYGTSTGSGDEEDSAGDEGESDDGHSPRYYPSRAGAVPSPMVNPNAAWQGYAGKPLEDEEKQHAADVAAYCRVREHSIGDMIDLYDQLRSSDITELETSVVRSIVLNGRRKLGTEVLEDVVYSLLDMIDETVERLNEQQAPVTMPPLPTAHHAPIPQPPPQPVPQPHGAPQPAPPVPHAAPPSASQPHAVPPHAVPQQPRTAPHPAQTAAPTHAPVVGNPSAPAAGYAAHAPVAAQPPRRPAHHQAQAPPAAHPAHMPAGYPQHYAPPAGHGGRHSTRTSRS